MVFLICSCHKTDSQPKNSGEETISSLRFVHQVNAQSIFFDTLQYENAAGNIYSIETLRYFISNLKFENSGGDFISIDSVIYIDARYEDTKVKMYHNPIPNDVYTAVHFTFGLDSTMNKPGRFKDFPEAAMEWPIPMGGGYHYLKLEGKYIDQQTYNHYNFHTGPFQTNTNYFDVMLPLNMEVHNGSFDICLGMEIQNWFESPHLINLKNIGGGIMSNQEMQELIKENGHDVFFINY